MYKIRSLLIDDSVLMRKALSNLLDTDPGMEVVDVAANADIACSKLARLHPDLVIIHSSQGLEAGIEIAKKVQSAEQSVVSVLLLDTAIELPEEAKNVGIISCFAMPSYDPGGIGFGQNDLTIDIRLSWGKRPSVTEAVPKPTAEPAERSEKIEAPKKTLPTRVVPPALLCIGSSTGGPNALNELVSRFPADFPIPIVIVQHISSKFNFVGIMAKRMDSEFNLSVKVADEGEIMKSGCVYIAQRDMHLDIKLVGGQMQLHLLDTPKENFVRPAVDVTLRAAAKALGPKVLSVILTGMGQDGLIGCRSVKEAGGSVVVQDEETSVVWGMPGCVAKANLADSILPLNEIYDEIVKRVNA